MARHDRTPPGINATTARVGLAGNNCCSTRGCAAAAVSASIALRPYSAAR